MFSHIIEEVSARAFHLMWLNIGLYWKLTKTRTTPILVSYLKWVLRSPKRRYFLFTTQSHTPTTDSTFWEPWIRKYDTFLVHICNVKRDQKSDDCGKSQTTAPPQIFMKGSITCRVSIPLSCVLWPRGFSSFFLFFLFFLSSPQATVLTNSSFRPTSYSQNLSLKEWKIILMLYIYKIKIIIYG